MYAMAYDAFLLYDFFVKLSTLGQICYRMVFVYTMLTQHGRLIAVTYSMQFVGG